MSVQTYVSMEQRTFAPLLDVAMDLVSRDSRWRRVLAEQIRPVRHDIILDLNCGDGGLAQLLVAASPNTEIVGIDVDQDAIERARLRPAPLGARLTFIHSASRDVAQAPLRSAPNKVVVSFMRDYQSEQSKREALEEARAAVPRGGVLYVADFTRRSGALVRRLIETVRPNDPREDGGALLPAIRSAGFEAVEETARVPTATGAISLYRARAA